jgi:hypothetical protein
MLVEWDNYRNTSAKLGGSGGSRVKPSGNEATPPKLGGSGGSQVKPSGNEATPTHFPIPGVKIVGLKRSGNEASLSECPIPQKQRKQGVTTIPQKEEVVTKKQMKEVEVPQKQMKEEELVKTQSDPSNSSGFIKPQLLTPKKPQSDTIKPQLLTPKRPQSDTLETQLEDIPEPEEMQEEDSQFIPDPEDVPHAQPVDDGIYLPDQVMTEEDASVSGTLTNIGGEVITKLLNNEETTNKRQIEVTVYGWEWNLVKDDGTVTLGGIPQGEVFVDPQDCIDEAMNCKPVNGNYRMNSITRKMKLDISPEMLDAALGKLVKDRHYHHQNISEKTGVPLLQTAKTTILSSISFGEIYGLCRDAIRFCQGEVTESDMRYLMDMVSDYRKDTTIFYLLRHNCFNKYFVQLFDLIKAIKA